MSIPLILVLYKKFKVPLLVLYKKFKVLRALYHKWQAKQGLRWKVLTVKEQH